MKNTARKTIVKGLCLLGAVLMLFTSCSSGEALLSYKDAVITENEFTYYLATYKANYLSAYTDFKDTADFYASQLGSTGMTGEEFVFDSILQNIKMTLVCQGLADEYGLQVSASTEGAIDDYIKSFTEDYAGGSKARLNQALSSYGINATMLKEIYMRDELGLVLFDHLYGTNGKIGVTYEDCLSYLNDNYVRIRHIYVNDKYVYATDENGVVKTNSDGSYMTEPLPADLQATQDAKVADIDAALANGEDFTSVYTTYSEDTLYENGYYLTRTTPFIAEVVSAAFELAEGEYMKVQSDVGTHYVMRLPMDDSPWEEEANADFFTDYRSLVATALFTEYIGSLAEEVEVDEELLSEFSVEASPKNYRF